MAKYWGRLPLIMVLALAVTAFLIHTTDLRSTVTSTQRTFDRTLLVQRVLSFTRQSVTTEKPRSNSQDNPELAKLFSSRPLSAGQSDTRELSQSWDKANDQSDVRIVKPKRTESEGDMKSSPLSGESSGSSDHALNPETVAEATPSKPVSTGGAEQTMNPGTAKDAPSKPAVIENTAQTMNPGTAKDAPSKPAVIENTAQTMNPGTAKDAPPNPAGTGGTEQTSPEAASPNHEKQSKRSGTFNQGTDKAQVSADQTDKSASQTKIESSKRGDSDTTVTKSLSQYETIDAHADLEPSDAPNMENWPTTEQIEQSLARNSRLYDSYTLEMMTREYIRKCRHFTSKPRDLDFLPETKSPCWRQGARTRCLPAFYIAGFAKCATTTLFELVNKHRQVASACEKEPNFWALTRFKPWSKTFESYIDCFNPGKDQITVDASPLYIWNTRFITRQASYPEQLERPLTPRTRTALLDDQILPLYIINQYTPNAKYILSIREPVERTYSYYNYLRRHFENGPEPNAKAIWSSTSPEDFHKLVQERVSIFTRCLERADVRACAHADGFHGAPDQVEIMFYGIYISDLLRVIPRENLLFINQHQISTAPRKVMERISNFLGLDPDPRALEEVEQDPVRANKGRGKPRPMLPQTRALLQKVYAPFNRQMARLLNDTSFLFDYS